MRGGKKAMSSDPEALGKRLRSLRESKGLTLRQVEAACGVSNPYLSQLETSKIVSPSPRILHSLAGVYDVAYEDLMEEAGYLERSRRTTP